jgi:OOP family OmpA-OmpF porin
LLTPVFIKQFLMQACSVCSRRFLYYIISFSFVVCSLAANGQPVPFTKTPAMGLNLAFIDFKGADKGTDFSRYMKPALALHFQNSFSRQFDYSITLAGSFLEFPDGKDGNLGNGRK